MKLDELTKEMEESKDRNERGKIRDEIMSIENMTSKSEGKFVTWMGTLLITVIGGQRRS